MAEYLKGQEWSYSRVMTFRSCPYLFYLKYLCDEYLPRKSKYYAQYGLYMHKMIEKYYTGEVDIDDLALEYVLGFTDEVSKSEAKPKSEITEKYFKQGEEYFKGFKPFPFNMVAVEKEVHFNIDGYKFTGFIDYLGEKDGEYYIVDNKSKDMKPRSTRKKPTKSDEDLDDKLIQLYLYSQAVKEEYGKYPKALCFNCFRTGVFIQEEFRMDKFEEAKRYIVGIIEEILETDEFNPMLSCFYCTYLCDLSHECIFDEIGR